MTTLTISLPDSLRDFIEEQVRTKGFENTNQFVQSLLREAQVREAEMRIDDLLTASVQDPRPDIPGTPEQWAGTRERLRQRSSKRAGSAPKR